MKYILEINNLTKNFKRLTAVNSLSLKVEKGHVYGLLGPNGSGKSTTLGMILNVINPSSGEWKWFGEEHSTRALKRIGAIIEHPNFHPYLTAEINLNLVAKIKETSLTKVKEKLELVGLLERKDDKFKSFSLGMKQRLAIAGALLNDPEVLILDEPTNGLDPQGIIQVREIIQKIAASGTTIILASHLLDEVEKVCSHVVILNKGKTIYNGAVDEMTANNGYFELKSKNLREMQIILKTIPEISLVKELKNNLCKAYLKSNIEPAKINQLFFEKGIVLEHLVYRKESLEEQFLQLTEKLS